MPALKPKETVSNSLASVVAHPLRARVLGVLTERIASPNEMANVFRRPVGHVNYQVKKLEELGFVELVDERPVRGAVEHFYRAIERPLITDDYALLTQQERNEFALHACQVGFANAAAALSTEVFSSRPDNCVCRTALDLDAAGWKEVARLHEETVLKTLEIQARSDDRRATSNEDGIRAESFVLFYEREHLTDWSAGS